MIRVGLVGAGFIGRNHFNQYEKLADRARVVALCDRDADRRAGDWSKVGGNLADAQGDQRDLGDIRPFDDWQKMLEDAEIDLVDVCAPTDLHRDITIGALERGKHVLVEKPMALSAEDCDAMIAAAENSSGRLMVAQCVRFWPEYLWLRKAIEEKRYGKLRALHLRRQTSAPSYSLGNWIIDPMRSGGAILDLHVHDVDFALSILGKPRAVTAQAYNRRGGGYDRVHASWHYDPEVVVQVEGFWDLYPGFNFNMGFTAAFDDASVVWDMVTGKPLRVLSGNGESVEPEMPTEDAYFAEIAYFAGCIERNEDPTFTTPQESRDAVMIALTEKQSARENKTLPVG